MNTTSNLNTSTKSIRVLLADDHTLVRAGIRALLEKLPGVEVAGEASDGREVMDLIKAHQPDVVLMDISMPGLNGLQALARITRDFPHVRVIILSMHNNDEYVLAGVEIRRVRLPAQEGRDGRIAGRPQQRGRRRNLP